MGSSKVMPSSSKRSLKLRRSGLPFASSPNSMHAPWPSKKAASALSATRLSVSSLPGSTVMRSSTRLHGPLERSFAISRSSIRCTSLPSWTRAKPCCCNTSRCSRNERPSGRLIGLNSSTVLSLGKALAPATTSSMVSRFTSRPVTGLKVWPTRAKSSLRWS